MAGIIYLVPTPIGNLADMTYRAVDVLNSVDFILAEDTRTSAKLLQHYQIDKPLRALHMHNEHRVSDQWVEAASGGQNLAVVTDAGSPGISDPGYLLARKCIDAGVEVISLPGATALIPALTNSGLPAHNFVFEGFLPTKKGRKTKLEKLSEEERTMIFYESPYRLEKTLKEMSLYFGEERQASVSREISKKFEETRRGSLKELAAWALTQKPKGEFVICVAGRNS
jgi:16S rRNA (cytidine1402-2'-O)-methyltransferase